MKRGETIIRFGWVLLGLLLIAAVLLSFDKPSQQISPLATSFDPGGAAALAELLHQEGYQVTDLEKIPLVNPTDSLELAFIERGSLSLPLPDPKKKTPRRLGRRTTEDSTVEAPPSVQQLTSQLKAGGRALIFEFDPDRELVNSIQPTESISDVSGHKYAVQSQTSGALIAGEFASADAAFAAWNSDASDSKLTSGSDLPGFAKMESVGPGRAIVVGAGDIALNSLIDKNDNAKLIVDMVKRLAPPGSKIAIVDGAPSDREESSLLDVLPTWVHGAWNQVLLLTLVIFYTLGKRFGIADESPVKQRGSRELVDGIADTMTRGRAAKGALKLLIRTSDRAIRRQLKLPADAPTRKRNELLPPPLAQTITACEHALATDITSTEAYELSRRLETEVDHFLGRNASKANRRPRRVKSA